MLVTDSDSERERLVRLADQLARAPSLTSDLVAKIVRQGCTRISSRSRTGDTAHLEDLVASQAWTDTALRVLESELPMWRLRQLVYDGDEWFCSLSRHCGVPVELDETADGRHPLLPLAILLALVSAKLLARCEFVSVPGYRQGRTEPAHVLCCDNFR